MASFPVNPHRIDPYKSFKFQVILDAKIVPNITKVTGLIRRTETVTHRAGSLPNHFITAPGLTSFDPITLERGITHDPTFEQWASLAYNPAGDVGMSLRNFRKDMRINLLNQQGSVVLSYMIYRCWVAEYHALPALDATENEVAMEAVVLVHEGFERDREVEEPQES